jgi:uncharacterized membrane protein (GlpM family)
VTALLIKAVVSGLVVALVNVLAQRNPGLGGWLASAPIVSVLSVIFLATDHRSNPVLSAFVIGVVRGLVPTALVLLSVWAVLKLRAPLPAALLVGVVIWLGTSAIARAAGIVQ